MLWEMSFRRDVVGSVASVIVLALTALLVGCGGDSSSVVNGKRESVANARTPEVELPPALPQPDTRLASGEPESVVSVSVPEPRVVSYEEAETAFVERRYGEAMDLFTLYSERRPKNPWGHYMLGLSAWKAGDHEQAEAAFKVALELDPQHIKSHVNLARVLLDIARPEEALEGIESALEIDPESNGALRLKGRALHELGRRDEAVDAYRQAILSDDGDAWSMNNLGLVLIEQGRFEEALLPLARAVELRDDVAVFQNNLGIALEGTGHLRAAEEAYRAVLQLDDSYEKAGVNLSRVEDLEEDPNVAPVDLADLARSFEDEIEGWREAIAYKELEESPMLDPVIVVPMDSVPSELPDSVGSKGTGAAGERPSGDRSGERGSEKG